MYKIIIKKKAKKFIDKLPKNEKIRESGSKDILIRKLLTNKK